MKSSMGPSWLAGLLDLYPSCSNTPEPYANAYRIGASNFATIASSSARVESATGRNWFRPNEGGRCASTWLRCVTAGRGAGLRRDREAGFTVGCFPAEGGGGGGCGPDEVAVSVDRERMTRVGSLRAFDRASMMIKERETRDGAVRDDERELYDGRGRCSSGFRRLRRRLGQSRVSTSSPACSRHGTRSSPRLVPDRTRVCLALTLVSVHPQHPRHSGVHARLLWCATLHYRSALL